MTKQMTNDEIIATLISDIEELIPSRDAQDINDPFGDYLAGVIDRSQSVLRMMGVPEDKIPNDGSC